MNSLDLNKYQNKQAKQYIYNKFKHIFFDSANSHNKIKKFIVELTHVELKFKNTLAEKIEFILNGLNHHQYVSPTFRIRGRGFRRLQMTQVTS